jgi:hypothetical protein
MLWWLIRLLLRWSLRLAILLWPVTLVLGAYVYMMYLR